MSSRAASASSNSGSSEDGRRSGGSGESRRRRQSGQGKVSLAGGEAAHLVRQDAWKMWLHGVIEQHSSPSKGHWQTGQPAPSGGSSKPVAGGEGGGEGMLASEDGAAAPGAGLARPSTPGGGEGMLASEDGTAAPGAGLARPSTPGGELVLRGNAAGTGAGLGRPSAPGAKPPDPSPPDPPPPDPPPPDPPPPNPPIPAAPGSCWVAEGDGTPEGRWWPSSPAWATA